MGRNKEEIPDSKRSMYKAERRLEEQSEKTESCQEKLWNEIQLKGP